MKEKEQVKMPTTHQVMRQHTQKKKVSCWQYCVYQRKSISYCLSFDTNAFQFLTCCLSRGLYIFSQKSREAYWWIALSAERNCV